MDVKNAIKTMNQASGKKGKDVAKELNITPSAYVQFIDSNLNQVDRLIKICNICGCQLQITNNNGITIMLDASDDKKPV